MAKKWAVGGQNFAFWFFVCLFSVFTLIASLFLSIPVEVENSVL